MNFEEFLDIFDIKKERDDYVIKKYIGDIKGTLIIPEGITKISNDAFEYSWIKTYPEISKIVFPKTLKKIPSCFSSWKHLKAVEIPEGVIAISDSAFFDTGIQTVLLPSTIDKIGKQAFGLCEDLKKITITHLSSSILNSLMNKDYISYSKDGELKPAFDLCFGCSQQIDLTDFFRYCDTNNEKLKFSFNNSFVLYGNYVVGYIGKEKSITIPDGVIGIAEESFINNSNIESVTFSDKIKFIGNSAFEGCKYLRTVTMNSSLETIGHYAFADCGIQNIILPSKIKNVGEAVFVDCLNLESITIVEKLIGDYRINNWNPNWKNGFYGSIKYDYI